MKWRNRLALSTSQAVAAHARCATKTAESQRMLVTEETALVGNRRLAGRDNSATAEFFSKEYATHDRQISKKRRRPTLAKDVFAWGSSKPIHALVADWIGKFQPRPENQRHTKKHNPGKDELSWSSKCMKASRNC